MHPRCSQPGQVRTWVNSQWKFPANPGQFSVELNGGSGNGRTCPGVAAGPFSALKDPRQSAKVLYPLPEVLLLALSATLARADDFVETVLWGTEHLAFLKRFYPYARGLPSHDTLCDVFAALDPAVHAEVEQLFNDPANQALFETEETVDLTAGRVETRHDTVCRKVDWMQSDRRYPGEPMFPDLAMLGRVETEVERNGKTERETRCYLCSLTLSALMFARVVRAHWGVENRLHWVLDVVFRNDLTRFRTGDGPQNMAIIRHTALNLLSCARPTTSLKNRRKRAGWNASYLETLIRQTA